MEPGRNEEFEDGYVPSGDADEHSTDRASGTNPVATSAPPARPGEPDYYIDL